VDGGAGAGVGDRAGDDAQQRVRLRGIHAAVPGKPARGRDTASQNRNDRRLVDLHDEVGTREAAPGV
jgi:hypothetical protein